MAQIDNLTAGNWAWTVTGRDGGVRYSTGTGLPPDTYRYATTPDSWVHGKFTIAASQATDTYKGEQKQMRHLYEIHVVEPQKGVVVKTELVVAETEDSAKLKVARMLPAELDLDDFDILVNELGDVRAKKTVKEVKVVG